jgi:hypothetical protein
MNKGLIVSGFIAILFIAGISWADEKSETQTALQTLTLNKLQTLGIKTEQGDAKAALILGEALYYGKITPRNYPEAARYYHIAAEHGSSMGQTSLGYMYDMGIGAERNQVEALALYIKAANHGYSAAMLNAAIMYESGIGVETDLDEAMYWYRRAAELGDPEAIEIISGMAPIHETEDTDVISNFLEDVLSLIPTELAETLDRNGSFLYKEANFVVSDDYWHRGAPGKADFLRDCSLIAKSLKNADPEDSQNTALQFGFMVRGILEIAMIPPTADPMNLKLVGNLKKFFRETAYSRWQIGYPGYRTQTFESIIDKLYGLKNSPKATIYPQIVIITADLWTTLWRYAGREPKSAPCNILRTSYLDNFI